MRCCVLTCWIFWECFGRYRQNERLQKLFRPRLVSKWNHIWCSRFFSNIFSFERMEWWSVWVFEQLSEALIELTDGITFVVWLFEKADQTFFWLSAMPIAERVWRYRGWRLILKFLQVFAKAVLKYSVDLSVISRCGWLMKIFHCFIKRIATISASFRRVKLVKTDLWMLSTWQKYGYCVDVG